MKKHPNNLPDAKEVTDFLSGRLSKDRAGEVEQALKDSPWGEDALEGLALDPELKGLKGVKIGQAAGGWSILQYLSVSLSIVAIGLGIWYYAGSGQVVPESIAKVEPSHTIAENTTSDPEEENKKEILPVVIEATSTDSSFSFTVEEVQQPVLAQEKPKEQFLEEERLEIPPALPTLDIDGNAIPVEEGDDDRKPVKARANIYHIRDYKVVDYRGIRSGNLSLDDLSSTGAPAGESVEDIMLEHLLDRDRMSQSVAYVDWLEYAMVAFAQERYTRAIKRFNVILIDYPEDANALFYKGMAHFYSQEYDKAQRFLERSQKTNIQTFQEESQFYRAESLRELGRNDEANTIYEIIRSEEGYYAERAEQRLR